MQPVYSPTPDDVWTLAWRAVAAATKLIPTDCQRRERESGTTSSPQLAKKSRKPPAPLQDDELFWVVDSAKVRAALGKPTRTLRNDLDEGIVRRDELFWDDGTPFS